MDHDLKHTAKTTKEFLQANRWNVKQRPSHSPDLKLIEHGLHLVTAELKGKCSKNKQELKLVAWLSITRDEAQSLVLPVHFIDCNRFAAKYYKIKGLIYSCSFVLLLLVC